MEAKKQAGRSPAAFFAEWPLSDPAMRPTRSVTGSAEARGAAAQRAPQTKKQLRRRRKVFHGGVSSVASRSRRSVTASAKLWITRFRASPNAHSRRWASFSPREPLRWVRAGSHEGGGAPPAP